MSTKIYTARDMRQKAFALELIGHDEAAAMLRQAADMMEREMKRGGSELDGWRKQALEENAALDIAREQLAKSNALVKELADALDVALENLSEECWTHCSLAEECAEKGNNSCIVTDSMKGLLERAREVTK